MNLKNKWTLSFIAWIILLIVMIIAMPNLDKLVIEKGQVSIPSTNESEIGARYLNELTTEGKPTYEFAVVFNRESGLTQSDYTEIESTLNMIQQDQHITILDSLLHTDSDQAKTQLVSEDGTTVIGQFSVSKDNGLAEDITEIILEHLKELTMDTYVTGSDVVIADFTDSTQQGIKKTEIIAVAFILIILIIIFKSPIVPFVSLASVGISYIISLSIVALLVEHWNLPFSNFTQVFLVVILFGVGTDYNILLFTRFKEELAQQGHVLKAITTTYKTAGKTVIYSGLAVFVGFVALFLAEFSMYQATGAVAIGIVILLAVLLTLNPFFMSLFGFKMFWPAKEVTGHKQSKIWGVLSKFGFYRPLISLLLIAGVTIPFIIHYSNSLNYNDLVEIDDKYQSKQAIKVIEEHYDAGFSSPVTLVVKGNDLSSANNLAKLDELAASIEQIDGVAKVFSVTRPEGQVIPELYVDRQAGTLNEGLQDAGEGVQDINEGLSNAQDEVSKPQDLSGVDKLISGTVALKNGANDLQNALSKLQQGVDEGANGANDIADGSEQLASKINDLQQGVTNLEQSYEQLAVGFKQYNSVLTQSIQALESAKQGYTQIEQLLTSANVENPSTEVQSSLDIAKQAQQQLSAALTSLNNAKSQYEGLIANFTKANGALNTAVSSIEQLKNGAATLADGAQQLQGGLSQASDGAGQISTQSKSFTTGLNEVNEGQKQLKASLIDLQSQMDTLAKGLKASTNGLDEIYSGLDDANRYLSELNEQSQLSFFIPNEVLKGEEFQQSIASYMNEQSTLTNMKIILDVNPYTEEAMQIVEKIRDVKDSYMQTSTLDEAYLAGKTMVNVDLQTVSQADFIRAATVMLIGIVIILLLVTRSVFQSLIIIGALVVTNFAALGITEVVTENLLGHDALSWNVPFFTLIMIVTLGVDYSIFFMMRFNESKQLGFDQILPAAKDMGSVVISAAIILGGTFAALIPSGIMTLIQVAIAVMIGLVLLSLVVMPILIPACFGVINKFKHRKK